MPVIVRHMRKRRWRFLKARRNLVDGCFWAPKEGTCMENCALMKDVPEFGIYSKSKGATDLLEA
jgi:hypothetical protein